MGFLSAGAHRRPDWACLTPSHPLPAEGKSVTLSQQRESRQSAVPVTSLAWPLSLPFLWLNILISGITEAIFFFPAEKQKQKQIYPQPLKQEGEFCGWRALKDSKIPKGICAPRPRKCPKPKASILPPPHPYFSTHRCPFPWHTGFLHAPLHPGENGCSSPSARTSQRWLATDTD